ncbi:unnamed protein product, partial [Pleuronectes platessa]
MFCIPFPPPPPPPPPPTPPLLAFSNQLFNTPLQPPRLPLLPLAERSDGGASAEGDGGGEEKE